MDLEKLKNAEAEFLDRYPGGFMHPEMVEIGKKHRMEKLIQKAQEVFAPENFQEIPVMAQNIIKTVTSSSMVSVFEKPKFRDYVNSQTPKEQAAMVAAVYQMLHGSMEAGFRSLVEVLKPVKLAKWTLVTVCPAYYRPREEVFIKPTTAKNVIAYFEVPGLVYSALPTWEFYHKYRQLIHQMKSQVSEVLSPDNAAFGGFLMISTGS
ncbi:MAG: hypothetical protein JXR70_04275 [Spirochaetales bacterium]|nr:hypothetical protein [Spirochaetales bacterium]